MNIIDIHKLVLDYVSITIFYVTVLMLNEEINVYL